MYTMRVRYITGLLICLTIGFREGRTWTTEGPTEIDGTAIPPIPDNGWLIACNASLLPLVFTGYDGVITSPYYPFNYIHNAICEWRIDSSSSSARIKLEFEEFITESCCDYLRIYDGPNVNSNLLRSMSGSFSPPVTTLTSQPYMFLRFTTDGSVSNRGFLAKYNSDPACREEFRIISWPLSGPVQSPFYPYNYPNNENCTWLIRGIFSSNVTINLWINTQYMRDYVKVTERGNVVGSLSGSTQFYYTSTSNEIFLDFFSDGSGTSTGFYGNYYLNTPPQIPKPMIPPSITIVLNGTVQGASPLDDACELHYYQQMKISAQVMTTFVNQLIEGRLLCYNASTGSVQWEYTTLVRDENDPTKANVVIDIDLSAIGETTLDEIETCANDVFNFMRVLNNWNEPIIPPKPGCPTLSFTSSSLQDGGTQWCKPLRELDSKDAGKSITFFPPAIVIPMHVSGIASSPLSPTCELAYDNDWTTTTQTLAYVINVFINRGEMCILPYYTGLSVLWQNAEFITNGGSNVNLTLILDLPGLTNLRISDLDQCATNILEYVSSWSNWPDPIFPTPPTLSCPSVTVSSSIKDDGMVWCKPPPFLPERRRAPSLASSAVHMRLNLLSVIIFTAVLLR